MKRLLRLSCFLLALSICSVMVLGWTEPGLRLLVHGLSRLSGGTISCSSARGALFLSFELQDLAVVMPDMQLRLGQLRSSWQLPELFDGQLHIADLAVDDVELRLSPQDEEENTTGDIGMPAVALPVALLLDRFVLDNFRLLGANFAELTRIDHLSFALAGSGGRIRMRDLQLRAPGYNGDLQGILDTQRQWHLELAGRVEYRDYGVGPFAGAVQVQGPLDRLDVTVDLDRPARGHVEGQIMDLPNNFRWQADLQLHEVQLADGHEILPELLFSVEGRAEGEHFGYGGTLKGRLDYLVFKDVAVEIEVHGNEDGIEFPQIKAENSHGRALLTDGLLSWKDGLRWHGHLVTEQLDPIMLLPQHPGAIDADLYSSGEYTSDEGLSLLADFRSFSGMLRGYPLAGHGRLEVDPRSMKVEDLLLQSGQASLRFNGLAEGVSGLEHWRDTLVWQAGLRLEDFDPGLFLPDYPGKLDTEIRTSGEVDGAAIQGSADIVSMSGVLRGYPVNGKGRVRLADRLLHFDDLLLQSGRSRLKVKGEAGENVAISANLVSENIGELLAGAGGSVRASATVKGDRAAPQVTATATAHHLRYRDRGLDSLQAELKGGLSADAPFAAHVTGTGLDLPSVGLQTVELALEGLPEKHTFSVQMRRKDTALRLKGEGALAEDRSWAGGVRDLQLSHAQAGTWRQKGTAEVAVSAEGVRLKPLCLNAEREKLCLAGQWSGETDGWQADANWQHLDLARLDYLLQLAEPLHGYSEGTITASGDTSRILAGNGSIEILDAGFGLGDGQSVYGLPELDQGKVDINLLDSILKTNVTAAFADGSSLQLAGETARFGLFSTSIPTLPLKGSVRADLKNLGFVAPLSRYYVRPTGSLAAELQLGGTLGNPVGDGRLELVDGQLEMPTLGITMQHVSCDMRGSENGIDVLAKAVSGPGNLQAEGRLALAAGKVKGDLHITGENFDTARLPEYELRTSPDLRFVFDETRGSLTGRVDIPHALIAPERMTGSVSVSDDVVFVDGDEQQNGSDWHFSTSLKLNFGDDVRLEGYGISGYLRGDLEVTRIPGSQMLGKGQLSMADGVFSIYGRSLSIERSRLLFAGGPVDNPAVDVRAKKIVADNKRPNETIEVGVEASGTADNLVFSLFSDPPMEESDILAYMVVGRAMTDVGQQDANLINSAAMALGVKQQLGVFDELTELLPVDELYIEGDKTDEMSLVVGKHLTDELFIGYGHNFFEQEGEVRLRYNLGAGFSIETRASGEQTGSDLLFSFEQ